ncbi:hypothetical protein PV325_010096 [Microctonus aethiopoides]|nr:hypothetical protein PV325_010096 [Microctonus aethiopoides]KAK0074783.1 hypothetical protein PV326_012177 [Microctonus aethiopoides]
MPLDPTAVGTEAGLDDVCGSLGAAATSSALDVRVHEPLASRCSDPRWETVDAGVMVLDIILTRNTQTIRINPPGGSGGLATVSQLPPIIRLIESLSPVLGSLFRAIEPLPIKVQDSIGPHDLVLDPSRPMCCPCGRER